MRNFKYEIFNPGGNKTALVEGIDFSEIEKKSINADILENNPDVEQVGFLDIDQKRLEMAGGEFCMNATRCAIWKCLNGQEGEISLKVSGCENNIKGGVINDNVFVDIRIEKNIKELTNNIESYFIVNLSGIDFIIIDEENSEKYILDLKKDENLLKQNMKKMMQNFNFKSEANGVILLEKENNILKINPIVWVKLIDTLYYETACGSGSLATAIYQKMIYGINKIQILQPSGYCINVELEDKNGILKNAIVSGKMIKER